jgi:hypothetical protein
MSVLEEIVRKRTARRNMRLDCRSVILGRTQMVALRHEYGLPADAPIERLMGMNVVEAEHDDRLMVVGI